MRSLGNRVISWSLLSDPEMSSTGCSEQWREYTHFLLIRWELGVAFEGSRMV